MSDEQESKLYLEEITEFCHTEYQNKKCGECPDCSYDEHCLKSCEKCLEYIHFPDRAPKERQYDCPNMANFYVCKFAHRYTSEIIYALQIFELLAQKESLNVLSVGCGPCTELFALDYVKSMNEYKFNSLDFIGIDNSKDVWEHVHNEIKKLPNYTVRFDYNNIFDTIAKIESSSWRPDLIIFQYVFSDMQKKYPEEDINLFIKNFSDFINEKCKDTYIIINDANLSTSYKGGREYFDDVANAITDSVNMRTQFISQYISYGEMHPNNNLCMKINDEIKNIYDPHTNCSSIQMLIKQS